jgi:hypothetical protein
MSRKEKLKFWCGMMAVVLLLSGGIGYLYSRWVLNNTNLEELKQRYTEIKVLQDKNANVVARAAVTTKEPDRKEAPSLNITFRAIGLERVSPGADKEIAFNVINEIRSSEYFDASKTIEGSEISPEVPLAEPPAKAGSEPPPGTFSFKIVAKLKRPLSL